MCITPLTLKRNRDEWQTDKTSHSTVTRVVPCGKCFQCLARRRNGWSFRLWHQMQTCESAYFMTLTYGEALDDYGHPFGEQPPTSFNGIYDLNKKHLQDFLKRLRKYQKSKNYGTSIKYYAVGEYGTKNLRPHYHLIIFNLLPELAVRSNVVAKEIWKKGKVDIASCNISTINYVVGYVMQGKWEPQADDDDRKPHFSLMSKGLGSSYLTDQKIEYLYDRMETSVMHPSGFRIVLPRYYKDKIFTIEEKAELNEIIEQMRDMSVKEWFEYDYKKEVELKKYKIKEHERKKKNTRCKV